MLGLTSFMCCMFQLLQHFLGLLKSHRATLLSTPPDSSCQGLWAPLNPTAVAMGSCAPAIVRQGCSSDCCCCCCAGCCCCCCWGRACSSCSCFCSSCRSNSCTSPAGQQLVGRQSSMQCQTSMQFSCKLTHTHVPCPKHPLPEGKQHLLGVCCCCNRTRLCNCCLEPHDVANR